MVYYGISCGVFICCFFFQAEDGIRDLVRSRGLGDVYKRQVMERLLGLVKRKARPPPGGAGRRRSRAAGSRPALSLIHI